MLRERTKLSISGVERQIVIDANLRDERISKLGLDLLLYQFGAGKTGTFPEFKFQIQQRNL